MNNEICDRLFRLNKASAAYIHDRLRKEFKIDGPAEPWLHVLGFHRLLIYYIWDTREIVDIKEIDAKIWPRVLGSMYQGHYVRDNGVWLKDPKKFANRVSEEGQDWLRNIIK